MHVQTILRLVATTLNLQGYLIRIFLSQKCNSAKIRFILGSKRYFNSAPICQRNITMQDDIEKIYAKLIAHESEIINLRQGYIVVNEKYTAALSSLRTLTISAAEAAKRACTAAERASIATTKCSVAAKEAANNSVIVAAEAAAARRTR